MMTKRAFKKLLTSVSACLFLAGTMMMSLSSIANRLSEQRASLDNQPIEKTQLQIAENKTVQHNEAVKTLSKVATVVAMVKDDSKSEGSSYVYRPKLNVWRNEENILELVRYSKVNPIRAT